jgi:S1-C subfamily serine protease
MAERGQDNSTSHPLKRRVAQMPRELLTFAAGVLAALTALAIYSALMPAPQAVTLRDVNEAVARAMASATPRPPFSVSVYEAIAPSLVLIQTKGNEPRGGASLSQDEARGLGSGVIVNERGLILTSLHVVERAKEIQVTFADGTEAPAVIIAEQPENDIAVLRPLRLPAAVVPATLGNPSALRVGDEAYVVGNPLGLRGSLSAGVISGLRRSFKPENRSRRLENLIQFDAAINPGSSGGPLLNRYGQVVGIVTALANPAGHDAFSGIGFAVPIDIAGGAAGAPLY